ncbi:MAG: hypothetical protein WC528_02905 [Patescibacteria group bacterium]
MKEFALVAILLVIVGVVVSMIMQRLFKTTIHITSSGIHRPDWRESKCDLAMKNSFTGSQSVVAVDYLECKKCVRRYFVYEGEFHAVKG